MKVLLSIIFNAKRSASAEISDLINGEGFRFDCHECQESRTI
jgi:hypothetical protein